MSRKSGRVWKWKLKTESDLNSERERERESNRCRVVVVVEQFPSCLIGEIYGAYGAPDCVVWAIKIKKVF